MLKYTVCIIFVWLASLYSLHGQNASSTKEYEGEYVTYSFSDPNPIPVFGKIYPYYRYDGFTGSGEKKSWKIVELENDFLKIKIFPEIGGKIWSVIDKSNGKELFYDNDVVKFRDISLRGPWTSGGIEFNYGVVGNVKWITEPLLLPPNPGVIDIEKNMATGDGPYLANNMGRLGWYKRRMEGKAIDIGCLAINEAQIFFMPGELFVEYQLAAKAISPDKFVAMAAYGDYGPFYIGTKEAYSEGGYEILSSPVTEDAEAAILKVIRNINDNLQK